MRKVLTKFKRMMACKLLHLLHVSVFPAQWGVLVVYQSANSALINVAKYCLVQVIHKVKYFMRSLNFL